MRALNECARAPTRYLDPRFAGGEGQLDFSGDMRDKITFSEQQFINTLRLLSSCISLAGKTWLGHTNRTTDVLCHRKQRAV